MPTLTNTTGTTTAPVCPYCGYRIGGVYSASTIIDRNGNEHHGCGRCMARCASCGGAARIARRFGSTGTAEQWERNPNFVNSRGADVILCQECFSHLSEDYELTTCPECLTTMDEDGAIYCEHCRVSVCRHCFEEAHRNCGRDNDLDDIGLIVISEDEGIDFEDPKDAFDPRDVNRSYRLKPENTHAEVNDTICVKVHAYDGTSFYRVDPDKKLSSYGT